MYLLYSIPSTASCPCRLANANPFIFMYIVLVLFIPLHKVVVVKLLGYLLDITACLELEAQAFRYTRIN